MKTKIGTKEYRKKMSKIAIERGYGKWMFGRKLPKETIEKMRERMLIANPFKGKKHSKTTKKKIGDKNRGRKTAEEV